MNKMSKFKVLLNMCEVTVQIINEYFISRAFFRKGTEGIAKRNRLMKQKFDVGKIDGSEKSNLETADGNKGYK